MNGVSSPPNPLRDFFYKHKEGRGIWKWDHYFDIYHRHFHSFRGREIHVVEIGVYSGGSLDMWRDYFGPHVHIYGVDIEPACKSYETDNVKILIGDQADREFWRRFRQEVPIVDIVIDDGGHQPRQQIVTLEELLPHLRPGGIYLCEDVHEVLNPFSSYMNGLVYQLNACDGIELNVDDDDRRMAYKPTSFQSAIQSVHFYPFVTVVERNTSPPEEFLAPKRGTQWQPFLR